MTAIKTVAAAAALSIAGGFVGSTVMRTTDSGLGTAAGMALSFGGTAAGFVVANRARSAGAFIGFGAALLGQFVGSKLAQATVADPKGDAKRAEYRQAWGEQQQAHAVYTATAGIPALQQQPTAFQAAWDPMAGATALAPMPYHGGMLRDPSLLATPSFFTATPPQMAMSIA